MKKKLLIYIFALFSFSSFAQDKAMLTKEETVNYINKKLQEVIGHYKTQTLENGQSGKIEYYWVHTIALSGDNVKIYRTRSNYTFQRISDIKGVRHQGTYYNIYPCDYYLDTQYQEFNPKNISSIEIFTNPISNEAIGSIQINLKSKTNQSLRYVEGPKFKFPYDDSINSEYWGKCYGDQTGNKISDSLNYAYINFLIADEDNFKKLKKALEHLRDLYKAEDDPFGE